MVRRVSITGLGLVVLVGLPLGSGLGGCAPSQGMAIEDTTVPPAALNEGFEPIATQINRERALVKGTTPLASRPVARAEPSRDPAYDPDSALASLPPVASPNEPIDAVAAGRPAPFANRVPEAARPQAAGSTASEGRPSRAASIEDPSPRPQRPAPATSASVPTLEPFAPAAVTPSAPVSLAGSAPTPIAALPARAAQPVEPVPSPPPVVVADEPAPPQRPTTPQSNPFASMPQAKPSGSATKVATKGSAVDRSVIAAASETLDRRPEAMTKGAGWVATVGEEIITWGEFQPVVQSRMRQIGAGGQQLDDLTKNRIAAQALDGLIEQSILVQEMKKRIKNPKMQTLFQEQLLRTWEDDELPIMLREAKAANIYELRALLEQSGQSIERIQRTYVRNQMAREMMGMEIRSKMKVDLPEMRAYYNENLKDFDRHAQIIWREIQVDFAKSKSKAEAKSKADAALQRVIAGEEFAKVAIAVSNGPTAAKGGLWETAPGSYNVPSVNATLDRLPVGQTSAVVESPTSYHIVKVESRREAGPARFDEVQDKIRGILFERKAEAASSAYLKKLRERTVVTTMFDGTASDPKQAR